MVEIRNLGAVVTGATIAAIAASILAKLAAGAVSQWLAVRATADEFREMQRMKDAGLRELAVLLAQNTAYPEWEWFAMLRNMRDYGMLTPTTPQPTPDPPGQNWMAWAIVAALVISVVFLVRK